MREKIKLDRGRMVHDVRAYGKDMAKIKEARKDDDPMPWHRSPACTQLRLDVDNDMHIKLTVQQLYLLQECYHKHFAIGEFRKHIYQEVDLRLKKAIWAAKKKKGWLYPKLLSQKQLKNDEQDGEEDDDGDEDD